MVAIPTIVHLCNTEGNGPALAVPTAVLSNWCLYKNRPKLNWAIPGTGTTGVLANPVTYLPWFDTSLAGGGNFTAYHHIAGILAAPYDVNLGDNHTSGGVGVSGSAWYMQKFAEKYTTSPYFKAIKLPYSGALFNNWKIGGSSYTTMGTKWTRAVAVAAPDTLDVKLIIIDVTGGTAGDIALVGSSSYVTYKADMTALINQLRNTTFSSANAKVILISHAPSYLLTTGTSVGALLFRQLNWELTTELTGVHVYEMSDDDLATSTGGFGDIAYGADRRHYEQDAYFKQGQGIYDIFHRVTSSTVAVNNSKYIPMFISIGDSQEVGPITGTAQLYFYSSGTSGPRVKQYVYHQGNVSIELLNPGLTCNLNNVAASTNIGPAMTLTERLGERYPDGYLFIHIAKNGSAVASTAIPAYSSTAYGRWRKGVNENYEQLQTFLASARTALLTQTGAVQVQKQAVLEGIFVYLGDNDAIDLTSATAYKPELKNLINNLRSDYGSTIYGIKTPVVLVRPHVNASTGAGTNRTLIRTGVVELSDELDQVGYVNIDDLDLNVDGLHNSLESALTIGVRKYDKLLEILDAAIPVI